MKKLSLKLLAFTFVVGAFLQSCGGSHEEVTEETTTEEVAVEDIEIESTDDDITYMLPSPLQVVSLFKNAGLEYVGGLTNPKENVKNYNSKYNQKLNFGVYAADMAYTITNNQTQESINYLNALRELSEKIWMTDVINSIGVAERLEKNVGNEDSLVSIMADLQMQLDDYLDENGSSYAGSIIFAGAWVETMYLALNGNNNENEKLVNRISEQSYIVENIILAVNQANEDKEFDELLASLENIKSQFNEIVNGDSKTLSAEKIDSLKAAVVELRTNIVNG